MSVTGVIHSEELPVNELAAGNRLRGLATRSLGSSEVALWNHVLDPGAEVPLHWHDHDQVIYVRSGSGRVIVGDEEVAVTAGDVVVAPGHIPHQVCAAAEEALDTLVAMPAALKSFRPDGSDIETPWHA
jgi:quercetin dioxygenase-like cupin family protein